MDPRIPPLARTLGATTHIDAAPAVVWQALCDTEQWRVWSSFHVVTPGAIEVGQPVTIAFRAAGRPVSAPCRWIVVEHERALWWRGGVPGLLDIRHGFDLVPSHGGTELVHTEHFGGLLGGLFVRLLKSGGDSYARTNEGLARFLAR